MIDEETYKQQMRAKQGKRKIRQNHIGNGRFMYKFIEGERKEQILWEEQVEIKPKGVE